MDDLVKDAIARDGRIARERTERVEIIPGYFAIHTAKNPVKELTTPSIFPPELHPEFRIACRCLEALRTVDSLEVPATVRDQIEPVVMVGHDFGPTRRIPDGTRYAELHRIYLGQCPICRTIWWQECWTRGPFTGD